MRRRDVILTLLIVLLTVFALLALFLPSLGRWLDREDIQLGLDLQGGAHLVYEADLSQTEDPKEAMKGVITVIERRINAYGVSEPVIQEMGENRLLVQLPGIKEIDEAKRLIGQTALIRFKEQQIGEDGNPVLDEAGNPKWMPAVGTINEEQKELTSAYFKSNASVYIPEDTPGPEVLFEWNGEGAKLSEQITEPLIGKPLGVFLGDEFVSAPIVRDVIRDRGRITGMALEEARRLTTLLNAGRIPVPLHTVEEHDVSPTLGADFIKRSLVAGGIGLALVLLFMVLTYRLPGVVAGMALLIYAGLVLATFKLIPVTLTLAGIAGFILSIGMAVDANVLIFERMREELRMGRTVRAAIEVGFNRAWPAIRDSNVSTLITCAILYWMGSTLAVPPVMGFALTLLVGVALSMFSAITITRTFLRLIGGIGLMRRLSLFVPPRAEMKLSREGR